jgi:ABC-type polar amino acid transport system ATPase subunit
MELLVKQLSKSYKDKEVLKNISFKASEGEILTIIGDSGCGKSTLLKILNFIETKNDGIIILGDETESQPDFRLNFGLVFQNFNLFPSLTVYDNILLPLKSKIKREIKKDNVKFFQRQKELELRLSKEKDYLNYLIDKLNIRSILNQYPSSLSGGQAQRVAIVRSLVIKPKVLCLDEPTSALDPKLVLEVANIIKSLKDLGMIIIVVTHDIKLCSNISGNIIFLKDGNILESGNKDILTNPNSIELKEFLS